MWAWPIVQLLYSIKMGRDLNSFRQLLMVVCLQCVRGRPIAIKLSCPCFWVKEWVRSPPAAKAVGVMVVLLLTWLIMGTLNSITRPTNSNQVSHILVPFVRTLLEYSAYNLFFNFVFSGHLRMLSILAFGCDLISSAINSLLLFSAFSFPGAC